MLAGFAAALVPLALLVFALGMSLHDAVPAGIGGHKLSALALTRSLRHGYSGRRQLQGLRSRRRCSSSGGS